MRKKFVFSSKEFYQLTINSNFSCDIFHQQCMRNSKPQVTVITINEWTYVTHCTTKAFKSCYRAPLFLSGSSVIQKYLGSTTHNSSVYPLWSTTQVQYCKRPQQTNALTCTTWYGCDRGSPYITRTVKVHSPRRIAAVRILQSWNRAIITDLISYIRKQGDF